MRFDKVLQHIGMIAGMESVAVTQHSLGQGMGWDLCHDFQIIVTFSNFETTLLAYLCLEIQIA